MVATQLHVLFAGDKEKKKESERERKREIVNACIFAISQIYRSLIDL